MMICFPDLWWRKVHERACVKRNSQAVTSPIVWTEHEKREKEKVGYVTYVTNREEMQPRFDGLLCLSGFLVSRDL